MISKLSPKDIKKLNTEFVQQLEVVIIAENINYAQNVASIFRVADAFAVKTLYLVGETHTPPFGKDLKKVSRSKEHSVKWQYIKDATELIPKLKSEGFEIIAIEQCSDSKVYTERSYQGKIAFLVGSEMFGVKKSTVSIVDSSVIIPMFGKGSSLNVHVALAVVLSYASSIVLKN